MKNLKYSIMALMDENWEKNIMMYHFITLDDQTEIVHSQVIEEEDQKKIIVNFERPTEDGFDSARCEIPDYKWLFINGYTSEDISYFEQLLHEKSNLMYHPLTNVGDGADPSL